MIDNVYVHIGTKNNFEDLFSDKKETSNIVFFPDFVRNLDLQSNEVKIVQHNSRMSELTDKRELIENLIVYAEDFASVNDHVILNFVGLTNGFDIENLYIQNPPKRVLSSLNRHAIQKPKITHTDYKKLDINLLRQIARELPARILGQDEALKSLVASLYRSLRNSSDMPEVVLLYGPSGVGKTETGKLISKLMGGKLCRIQFSMLQNLEAYDYLFGNKLSRSSFAFDLLSRESNVIMIDEFDKVHPNLYNAFYEVFDKGTFEDKNYKVNLKDAIFLLTSNYQNETEILQALGPAMFSRISKCVHYSKLNSIYKNKIIEKHYSEVISTFTKEEKDYLEKIKVKEWFLKNSYKCDNIRTLKTKLENAIFDELIEHFVYAKL